MKLSMILTIILGLIGYVFFTRGHSIIYFHFSMAEMFVGFIVIVALIGIFFRR